jgi:hypothetical protein
MARGATTPRWNSSSVHGKALEARITELHHGGQLIDGQTTFQEVIDGVPELSLYSRDALRRAAKVFAAQFGVNLAMNGKFLQLDVPRWPISFLLIGGSILIFSTRSRRPQSPCCSSCGRRRSCGYGGHRYAFAGALAASAGDPATAGPLDHSEVDVRPAFFGCEVPGLDNDGINGR